MKDKLFSEDDPVLVLTFFAELTEECNNLDISEEMDFVALPYLLKSTAK